MTQPAYSFNFQRMDKTEGPLSGLQGTKKCSSESCDGNRKTFPREGGRAHNENRGSKSKGPLSLVLTDLVLLVFEDGDFEELRVLDADAAKCQVALENLGE